MEVKRYACRLNIHRRAGGATTSFPGSLLKLGRDPGWGWSRVFQNLGVFLNVYCLGGDGSVSLVIIARNRITTHLILGPDDHPQNVSRQGIECTTHGIRRDR